MTEIELVPPVSGSALSLSLLELESEPALADAERDSLLYVVSGAGAVTVDGNRHELGAGDAALVLAGEEAALDGQLSLARAAVGPEADRHAPLGPREVVARAAAGSERATGSRSYRVLFGPENGSTRATLFAGFVPPGRAPWHFHLYDEIVWVPEGPARLHLEDGVEEVGAGSAIRLRPRQVHILENAGDRTMTVLGVFTPAGSPSAAYLA